MDHLGGPCKNDTVMKGQSLVVEAEAVLADFEGGGSNLRS